MEWKVVKRALSLETSPHKYWEMGMNVGGINQEGDHLGRVTMLKRWQYLWSYWEECELGGWAEAGTSALKKKQEDQREKFKAQ